VASSSISLATLFAWAFFLSVPVLFVLLRYCENHRRCDSIGTWYTVYSSVGFALLLAGLVVEGVGLLRALRKHGAKRRENERSTDA